VTRQDHAAPILARLAAAAGSPAPVVYDNKVPDNTTPPAQYYVMRFAFRALTASESPATTSLTFDSETYRVEVTVYSVGPDARSVRGVASRAEAQLLNWTPTVTGRSCSPLRQVESQTYEPNEALGVPVEQQVDVYRFISQPG
jgi:hypothetical protein